MARATGPAHPGRRSQQESPAIDLRTLFDISPPIHVVWWAIFGQTLSCGLAIAILTGSVQLVLAPLFQLQLSPKRRSMQQHRFVSNCFSIIQQYFVTGWGGLRPQVALEPAPAPAAAVQAQSRVAKRTRRASE